MRQEDRNVNPGDDEREEKRRYANHDTRARVIILGLGLGLCRSRGGVGECFNGLANIDGCGLVREF